MRLVCPQCHYGIEHCPSGHGGSWLHDRYHSGFAQFRAASLDRLRDESGCTVKVASIKPDGSLDFDEYERLLSEVAFAMLLQPMHRTLRAMYMTLPVWLRLPISMVPVYS